MKKLFVALLVVGSGFANAADEYSCKVYCQSGSTYVTVRADSRAEAASIVDKMPDQVCKGENKGNKTSSTMKPEQCSKK